MVNFQIPHNLHIVVTSITSTFTVHTEKKESYLMALPCIKQIQSLPSRVAVNVSVNRQTFTYDKAIGKHCFLNV